MVSWIIGSRRYLFHLLLGIFLLQFLGVELNLADNNLVGTFPRELSFLPYLTELDIARNKGLNGTILEFESSKRFFRVLHELRLGSTSISGTIPANLSFLTLLHRLELADNKLTGTIPTSLGVMSDLNYLLLNYNELSGAIPSELGRLLSLEILDLSTNALTGTIPVEFVSLVTMELLGLRNNVGVSGTIPSILGDLPRLGTTLLSNTTLSGSVPERFCNQTIRSRSYDVLVVRCSVGFSCSNSKAT